MRLNSDPNDWIQCEFTGKPITNTNDSVICYQILTALLVRLRTCIVTASWKIKCKQKPKTKNKKKINETNNDRPRKRSKNSRSRLLITI